MNGANLKAVIFKQTVLPFMTQIYYNFFFFFNPTFSPFFAVCSASTSLAENVLLSGSSALDKMVQCLI